MNKDKLNLNQRPIPDAALRDENSVEMLRVWIAERKLHCSIKIGMYQEKMNIPEEKAWGTILADVARHVSNAVLESGYSTSSEESLKKIREFFIQELEKPSSKAEGGFVKKH